MLINVHKWDLKICGINSSCQFNFFSSAAPSRLLNHFFPTMPSPALSCLHDWTLPWRISAPVYAFVFPLPRRAACYLRHSRLEQLSPLSPSPLYLQTSYKSLPEIWGKLQEAANYNIHRACTNPRAYPCRTLGHSEVCKTGCENRFPCFEAYIQETQRCSITQPIRNIF